MGLLDQHPLSSWRRKPVTASPVQEGVQDEWQTATLSTHLLVLPAFHPSSPSSAPPQLPPLRKPHHPLAAVLTPQRSSVFCKCLPLAGLVVFSPSSSLTLQKSRHTESEKLQVQIQAYLDNVFDVGGLLEDAETKNVALEKVEELEEHLSHVGIQSPPFDIRTPLGHTKGPSCAASPFQINQIPVVNPQRKQEGNSPSWFASPEAASCYPSGPQVAKYRVG